MERKMRHIKFDVSNVPNPNYMSGRISGICSVATNIEPDGIPYGFGTVTTSNGKTIKIHPWKATDEELEIIKRFLWTNDFWRKVIEIETEE